MILLFVVLSRLDLFLQLVVHIHIYFCLSPGVAQPLTPPEGPHTPPDQDDHHQYTTLIYISPPGQVETFHMSFLWLSKKFEIQKSLSQG